MSPENTLYNNVNDGGYVSQCKWYTDGGWESKEKNKNRKVLWIHEKRMNLLNQYRNIKLLEVMVVHKDWRNLIGYLSGFLLQYFGQIAVLGWNLMMWNKRVSLVDCNI